MTAEDIIVDIFLIFVGAFGIYLFKNAVDKWRVLFSSFFWPEAEARMVSFSYKTSDTTTYSNDTSYPIGGTTQRVEHDFLGGTRVTNRSYTPFIEIEYNHNGRNIKNNNQAHYNQKLYYGNKMFAQEVIDRYKGKNFKIKYNPFSAKEFYFGFINFPYIWAFVELFISYFLSVALIASISDFLELLGVVIPRLNGKTNILVFIIPILGFLYFLFYLLIAILKLKKDIKIPKA